MSEQELVLPPSQFQGTLDVSAATAELTAFVEQLKLIPPPPEGLGGEVQVSPGGARFTTIADALNSITDAGPRKAYTIYVGSGVFEENVVCKPWVFIEGSDPDVTTIRAPLGVTGASNSSIGGATIEAGRTAIGCVGTVNFAVANCFITASDGGKIQISNYIGISVDFSAGSKTPSTVSISYSTIQASVKDTLSITVGVVAASNAVVLVNFCKKITAQGGGTNMGCAAGTGANIHLSDCSISAPVWALRLLDDQATMMATRCSTDGEVSPGVVINGIADGSAPSDLPRPHGAGHVTAAPDRPNP
jgi:hypothetical protein